MSPPRPVSRRDALLRGGSVGLLGLWLASLGIAGADRSSAQTPSDATKAADWEDELARILKGATPVDAKLTLDVTDSVENGNTVPFSVSVESPMTADNHIKTIYVMATGNRQPLVGAYRLGPDNGTALVSSRMRLAQTQEIFAVVERSDGAFIVAKRTVKVGIACCGY